MWGLFLASNRKKIRQKDKSRLKQLVSKPKQNQEIKEIHNEVDLKEVNEVYSKINFVNRNILKKKVINQICCWLILYEKK